MNVSVIIPVRDRWQSLSDTLRSLDHQSHLPFEVIVVDDGSAHSAPEYLRHSMTNCSLQILCQAALGIAAARNNGIAVAHGEMILFTDSDCVLKPNCIQETVRSAAVHHESVAFQLAFVPANDRLVWRVDGAGKRAKQRAVVTPSGHIRSLDTGGFAIRRAHIETNSPLFDVTHIRGEDTALLTALIAAGHLPRFVEDAQVEHRPIQKLGVYLFRQFRAGYRAAPARAELRAASSNALLNSRGRFAVLRTVWTTAPNCQTGTINLVAILICYLFELCGRLLYAIVRTR